MPTELHVPLLPESVTDAQVLRWHKAPPAPITQGETLLELETDKVVLEVPAPLDGLLLEIVAPVGRKVHSGELLALLDAVPRTTPVAATPPVTATDAPPPDPALPAVPMPVPQLETLSPSARRQLRAQQYQLPTLPGSESPQTAAPRLPEPGTAPPPHQTDSRAVTRTPLSRIRLRIAERLLASQQQTATLTTFNEVNLAAVQTLRQRYKDEFLQRHGQKLGLMSFFVRAVTATLQRFPILNARLEGELLVQPQYCDLSIAVATPRGLVTPVLRNAEQLSFAAIERAIADFAARAKENRLTLAEIQGGTFSISNGGSFGSLLSTPILNPPQSAILGMHALVERPIAEQGQVVIRPMMYLALSYDHRLIDGQDAVQALVHLKTLLQAPERLLLEL